MIINIINFCGDIMHICENQVANETALSQSGMIPEITGDAQNDLCSPAREEEEIGVRLECLENAINVSVAR
jgi:hypothetical protein